MKKKYNQAPLPFMGQKRKFLNKFKEYLMTCPTDATYVDLFGGSGLLSRAVKDTHPKARVIYNDFDNYKQRIEAIPATNQLLMDIRSMIGEMPKDKRLDQALKNEILDRISKETGFVDYITISSSLLFSMNYATCFEDMAKSSFYNCVRLSDYDASGYLDGLEVVRMSYRELFKKFEKKQNVLFIVDPPYLSTEVGTYTGYWKLADYLDVLTTLNSKQYFYFTSNKSHILELCEWMGTYTDYSNPFKNAVISTTKNTMNYNSTYTDIMVFKGYTTTV
ncbi:MAG: DNA methyltransferase [Niastella sp. SCN 39-18]|nr:DNA adenine methylase [Sphingobacteriales bacterium]ODT55200.1 MAG: DNA methyltransferase [Niastella sp. SCN 39-18]OJW09088.1 MAG: DNA methyltransferase [Sphingobacteriales bacterium 39-19]